MSFNITSMLKPSVYSHPVGDIQLIETHISWVILTGEFAYKIKKPVNFGFLDFSTLEKRKHCCEEELRLNIRLAPQTYLQVVGIGGNADSPIITMQKPFEYAVKMQQFPQSSQLDNMLAAGTLSVHHIDKIADMVANFHQQIQFADESMNYGSNQQVLHPVKENLEQIQQHMDTSAFITMLNQLSDWVNSEYARLSSVFTERKAQGFIRECHGDMHLRNMLWLNNMPQAFDCIEFNANLRWIDVISEVAFLVMDLQDRQQSTFASRFLNRYLEQTGDYAALRLLPFYLCYRALVRAKVNALRLEQNSSQLEQATETLKEFTGYLQLATGYTQAHSAKLIIMHGMSACGKSTVSQQLIDRSGASGSTAIRIRSDIERKRLFNIEPSQHLSSGINTDIYTVGATQKTYERLLELCEKILTAGYSVIVDATFQKHSQRIAFQQLADNKSIPYKILHIQAPIEILRKRIRERKHNVSDADSKVLEYQYTHWQPLETNERAYVHTIDTTNEINFDEISDLI